MEQHISKTWNKKWKFDIFSYLNLALQKYGQIDN
jgi:hypothetical protein